jgi:hypothetical protein
MKIILRNIVAVVVALVVGSIANMVLVKTGHHFVAAPAGVDMNDLNNLKENGHLLEAKHFLFPFLAHAGGTFVGAIVAFLIAASRRELMSYVIGIVFLAGGTAAAFMIPAPAWFLALDLLVAYLPMAWLGARIGSKFRKTA